MLKPEQVCDDPLYRLKVVKGNPQPKLARELARRACHAEPAKFDVMSPKEGVPAQIATLMRSHVSRRAKYDAQDGIQASLPPYAALNQPSNSPRAVDIAPDLGVADQRDASISVQSSLLLDQPVEESPEFHQNDMEPVDTGDSFLEGPEVIEVSSGEQFCALEKSMAYD
ncbi:hypothetical protein G7Z17_g1755 [Cylindrodendrum hubeiense]|uniref:Uncharacterized protein n=1 Tax=Cylindrodendrum hubeiense TaxID=595255 RepID=A0A9P5HIW5_9HYPO|nr:hypothetical protein G7Z17_g1755 [Cylindrodendrum hubeiense]